LTRRPDRGDVARLEREVALLREENERLRARRGLVDEAPSASDIAEHASIPTLSYAGLGFQAEQSDPLFR
jgi:hypothetical protein